MNKLMTVLAVLVVMSVVFVSGCVEGGGTTVNNAEQASDAVDDVSDSLEDVMSELDSIDESLGGSGE